MVQLRLVIFHVIGVGIDISQTLFCIAVGHSIDIGQVLL